MYAIYCETGAYSGYSRSNIFLVETEELADQFVTAYNYIARTVEHDFPIWQKEWLAAHPQPTYFYSAQLKLKLPEQPTPDPFLKTLSKKDRAVHPLQTYFKKQLEDWNLTSKQMRERHATQHVRSNEPHKAWCLEQSQAKQTYLDVKVHDMMVACLGVHEAHEQVETWIKSNWDNMNFNFDELEVVG